MKQVEEALRDNMSNNRYLPMSVESHENTRLRSHPMIRTSEASALTVLVAMATI